MRSMGGGGGMLLVLLSEFGLETHGSVGCLSRGHDFMKELVNTTLEDYHQCMPEEPSVSLHDSTFSTYISEVHRIMCCRDVSSAGRNTTLITAER